MSDDPQRDTRPTRSRGRMYLGDPASHRMGPWARSLEFFDTRAQRTWDRYREQRWAELDQLGGQGSLSQHDTLVVLAHHSQRTSREYMARLRAAGLIEEGLVDPGDDENATRVSRRADKHLSEEHRIWASGMVSEGLKAISNTHDPAAVIHVMGIWTGLYLASPNFRQYAHEKTKGALDHVPALGARQINVALSNHIDRMAQRSMDRATLRSTQMSRQTGAQVDPRTLMPAMLRARYDSMRADHRGLPAMWTPASVGMSEAALAEKAFVLMHQPGADSDQIAHNYESMVSRLYDQGERDGLSRSEMAASAQQALALRMRDEPRLAMMVPRLADGSAVKGDPRSPATWLDQAASTRHGDPERPETITGGIAVRRPGSAQDHQEAFTECTSRTLKDAAARGDEAAFSRALVATMGGCLAQARDVDGQGLGDDMADQLARSRQIIAAMSFDGHSLTVQRDVCAQGVSAAMADVSQEHPEFYQAWKAHEGRAWEAFTQTARTDPQAATLAFLHHDANTEAFQQARTTGLGVPLSEQDRADHEIRVHPEGLERPRTGNPGDPTVITRAPIAGRSRRLVRNAGHTTTDTQDPGHDTSPTRVDRVVSAVRRGADLVGGPPRLANRLLEVAQTITGPQDGLLATVTATGITSAPSRKTFIDVLDRCLYASSVPHPLVQQFCQTAATVLERHDDDRDTNRTSTPATDRSDDRGTRRQPQEDRQDDRPPAQVEPELC
jgi:hypothetical protein